MQLCEVYAHVNQGGLLLPVVLLLLRLLLLLLLCLLLQPLPPLLPASYRCCFHAAIHRGCQPPPISIVKGKAPPALLGPLLPPQAFCPFMERVAVAAEAP